MIKKMLIPLMMMLTTLAVVPSGETIKANAEETTSDLTNKTKAVEKGYITNNFVDSSTKTINFTDDIKTKFENNFIEVKARKKNYDDTIFKSMLEPYGSSIIAHRSDGYVIRKDVDNTKWTNTSYLIKRNDGQAQNITYERLMHIEYGLDYYFKDYDDSKEQPLELALEIDFESIKQGILLCYPFVQFPSVESITKPTEDFEDVIPVISINGFNYLSAVFKWNATNETYTITYKSYNSRCYIAYNNNEYAGYVFMEIPFINYLTRIKIASYSKCNTTQLGGIYKTSLPVYFLKQELESGLNSPIVISDLDFNNGILKAITSNSVYTDSNGEISINAVDTERIRLDSIIIDGITLYTKSLNKISLSSEESYELYVDSSMNNKFTYASDNNFVKKMQNSEKDFDFNLSKYNYTKLKKETDDSEVTSESAFVDCGTFYAFRYNCNFNIHTLNVNAIETHDFSLSRLFFNILDIDTSCDVNKINGVMFYYSYKKDKTKRSLAIVNDKQVNASGLHFFGIAEKDKIKKIDSRGTSFSLRAATFWELSGLVLSFRAGELMNNSDADVFVISTEVDDIIYDAVVSILYTNKKGDIINLSGLHDKYDEGYTAVINDDGKVSIIDKDKNVHEGYYVDENGIFRDNFGKELDHDSVKHDDWWKKLLAAISTVLIIGGTVYVVSKIGPILAIVFTNRSKNKKKKRRK